LSFVMIYDSYYFRYSFEDSLILFWSFLIILKYEFFNLTMQIINNK
jgi:hypothetical protein